jgi:hypothetical protein
MTPTIYYCYDAYCGWCYGFSPVIRRLFEAYKHLLAFEVLSGGMILPETPQPIGVMADYIREAYPTVEKHTGIKFGEDWLWHILNPDESYAYSKIIILIWPSRLPATFNMRCTMRDAICAMTRPTVTCCQTMRSRKLNFMLNFIALNTRKKHIMSLPWSNN